MHASQRLLPLVCFVLLSASPGAVTAKPASPNRAQSPKADALHFFEGRTETAGTVKAIMRKPYRTRSLGRGRMDPDGTLILIQRVEDEGKPPRERRWRIRQTAAGHYSGTMSEASGPIAIDEVGGRYRFRFKMKGNLSVEQWIAPLPGGVSARNLMTVRKFGMVVATGDGTIRRLGGRPVAVGTP
jgi:hypothetical protein